MTYLPLLVPTRLLDDISTSRKYSARADLTFWHRDSAMCTRLARSRSCLTRARVPQAGIVMIFLPKSPRERESRFYWRRTSFTGLGAIDSRAVEALPFLRVGPVYNGGTSWAASVEQSAVTNEEYESLGFLTGDCWIDGHQLIFGFSIVVICFCSWYYYGDDCLIKCSTLMWIWRICWLIHRYAKFLFFFIRKPICGTLRELLVFHIGMMKSMCTLSRRLSQRSWSFTYTDGLIDHVD